VAERVPDGPSTRELIKIAREHKTVVMAGLVEEEDGKFYNTYVTAAPEGYITKYRKLHVFISPFLSPGQGYNVIDLLGCKIGFLICYDNNLPENNRITAMMGAEIIFMPHVTGCLPSVMPGRGTVDKALWDNRHADPVRLRQEFHGPKARSWMRRFLPCRCWENGVYGVFSNPIGVDGDTIKPGLATIFDPFGETLEESHALEDDVVVGLLTAEKIEQASGRRYIRARRPDIYGKLVEPPPPGQKAETLPGPNAAS
jgi:predicted amidohydrolase